MRMMNVAVNGDAAGFSKIDDAIDAALDHGDAEIVDADEPEPEPGSPNDPFRYIRALLPVEKNMTAVAVAE